MVPTTDFSFIVMQQIWYLSAIYIGMEEFSSNSFVPHDSNLVFSGPKLKKFYSATFLLKVNVVLLNHSLHFLVSFWKQFDK